MLTFREGTLVMHFGTLHVALAPAVGYHWHALCTCALAPAVGHHWYALV